MKAAHGKQITCSLGHDAGYFQKNVREGEPILESAFVITEELASGPRWICRRCQSLVAEMRPFDQTWRVHTQEGWIQ